MKSGPPSSNHIGPAYHQFLQLFNRGRFWDSHEALETRWRETGSAFYHGLILYASAFVHVQRGNRHGIGAQLRKARAALAPFSPAYLGLDVEAILRHLDECSQLVAENPQAPRDAWAVLIPAPRLHYDPDRVRGDEPELPGS